MDKARKLRRYERKDYTQLVDFPVEIVGRDGVVRRYSFEESIRLYQRRISSAQARYADGDVVDAEVVHCRQRIGQLRRSYFARYGWSALRVADRPGLLAGEFAGEVAAFLRRVAAESADVDTSSPIIRFALLEDQEHHQLYFIRRGEHDDGPLWLLYLYRFSASGACAGREAFFRALKLLQSVATSPDSVEQLLGFHHTADCGIILTGTDTPEVVQAESRSADRGPIEWLDFAAVDGDPLQAAFTALRRGKLSDALARFTEAYEAQPFRRAAYVGAGVVADQLGAFDAAETAALMGVRYLPEDDLLQHHLALVHLRMGRLAEARGAAAVLAERRPDAPSNLLLKGLIDLAGDRWPGGVTALFRAHAALQESDTDLTRAARRVLLIAVWAAVLGAVGSVVALTPFLVGALGHPVGTVPAAVSLIFGLTIVAVAALGVRARVQRLITAPSGWGLRISNPQSLRTAPNESERTDLPA